LPDINKVVCFLGIDADKFNKLKLQKYYSQAKK